MHLHFVSQYYSPEPFSNSEIVDNIILRGASVEVVTSQPNYPEGKIYKGYQNRLISSQLVDNYWIHRVLTFPRGRSSVSLALNHICFAIFGSLAAFFLKPVKKPDIVFVSQLSPVYMILPGYIISRKYRVPLIVWVQDLWPDSIVVALNIKNKLLIRLLGLISEWLYRQADCVLLQNHAFMPYFHDLDFSGNSIDILPNTFPLDLVETTASTGPKDFALNTSVKDIPTIVYAGNIGKSQSLEILLYALNKMIAKSKPFNVILIGDGRAKAYLESKCKTLALGDYVSFAGKLNRQEVLNYYSSADFLYLSLADNPLFSKTVPRKLQDYLLAGKPIIASIGGESERVIKTANAGFVAKPGDVESLVEILSHIRKLPKTCLSKIGKNGRAYFEINYHPEVIYDSLYAKMKSILSP